LVMMAQSSAEFQKTRQHAMLAAMERMRNGGQEHGAELLEKTQADNRRCCQEIQDLRGAVQKMLDQFSAYMSHDSIRSLAEALRLDARIFTIPGEFDTYRDVPFPVEGSISRKDLEQVTAERDIAKMKLAVVSRELEELKSERRRYLTSQRESTQQRVPKPPMRRDAEEKSACAVDCSVDAAFASSPASPAQSFCSARSASASAAARSSTAARSWRSFPAMTLGAAGMSKAGRNGAEGSAAARVLPRGRSSQLVLSRELELPGSFSR
jgi:hypothetical protein